MALGLIVMNQYPLWKYLLLIAVLLVGGIYALPNIYGNDPAVQVSAKVGSVVDTGTQEAVESILLAAGIHYKEVSMEGERLVVRFRNTEDQLRANMEIRKGLGDVAILLRKTLCRLRRPGYGSLALCILGLDLRGGVHLLLEVDMEAAVTKAEDRYVEDIRSQLRDERVRYLSVKRRDGSGIEVRFRGKKELEEALEVVKREFPMLEVLGKEVDGKTLLVASMSEQRIQEVESFAIEQKFDHAQKSCQ